MNDLKQKRDNQIDEASGLVINCRNCAHCAKSSYSPGFDKCLKSGGESCEFIQKYPSFNGHICKNYSSWTPREKSILELLLDRIRKMLSE